MITTQNKATRTERKKNRPSTQGPREKQRKMKSTRKPTKKKPMKTGSRRQPSEGANVTPHPPVSPLDDAKRTFKRWLHMPDLAVLDFVYGVFFALKMDGDPVWGGLVGAPGDTKTELLRSLQHPQIQHITAFTPQTLISGLPASMSAGRKEPSLLPKLDGKVLIVKDFTPIISGSRDRRSAILGQLRDAYDGSSAMAFGTGETKSFESRFGLLFAVTPAIESCWPVINTLGERFIYYRCHGEDSLEKAEAAMDNSNHKSQMRTELAQASRRVLDQHAPPTVEVGKSIRNQIVHLADFVAKARTPVEREGRSEEMTYTPSPEIGTRLAGQFVQLARGITVARGEVECPESLMEMIRYVGRSAIPHTRLKLLEQLSRTSKPESTDNLGQVVGLGTGTVSRALHDLWALKLVDREKITGSPFRWKLSQLARDRLSVTKLL